MKYTYKSWSSIGLLLTVTQCAAIPTIGILSWFKSTNEQVLTKEFPIKTPGLLTVDNLDGAITIKVGNQPKIFVSAVKRTAKEEDLDEITVDVKHTNDSTLHLTTKYDQKDVKGGVDYTLVIPAHMDLKLANRDGAIMVHGVTGTIHATTKNGDIELVGPKRRVDARTKKTGNITIHQPGKNMITAHTAKGAITIYDAQQTVHASTEQGAIEISYAHVPNTSRMVVESTTGDIMLYIPNDTNAELNAKTDKGSIRCDLDVAIKPFTTQLNNRTWNKLKKEVHGTIGSGEAEIKAHSKYGNIKILRSE
ncbi:MAG: DUF4097 family beta strand repeat-containing protein [Candidatus Babeliales bacterium]